MTLNGIFCLRLLSNKTCSVCRTGGKQRDVVVLHQPTTVGVMAMLTDKTRSAIRGVDPKLGHTKNGLSQKRGVQFGFGEDRRVTRVFTTDQVGHSSSCLRVIGC